MAEGHTPSISATTVPLPPTLPMTGNLAKNWLRWKQMWESYEIVTNLKGRDHRYRIATFISTIGPDALDVFNELSFENKKDKKNLDVIIKLMENYFVGKVNVTYERYVFNDKNQAEGETIDSYVTKLRSLADTCNFGEMRNELIRDRIVSGITNNMAREKLLEESGLTLRRCIDICKVYESKTPKKMNINADNSDTLNSAKTLNLKEKIVSSIDPELENLHVSAKPKKPKTTVQAEDPNQMPETPDVEYTIYGCRYCGEMHELKRSKCPAFREICSICKVHGHFALKCPLRFGIDSDSDEEGFGECKYCGDRHELKRTKCPAVAERCWYCNEFGHFGRKCPRVKINLPVINVDGGLVGMKCTNDCTHCDQRKTLNRNTCPSSEEYCSHCKEIGHSVDKCPSIGWSDPDSDSTEDCYSDCYKYVFPKYIDDCKFCGQRHKPSRKKCPASAEFCPKCKEIGHFANKCPKVDDCDSDSESADEYYSDC